VTDDPAILVQNVTLWRRTQEEFHYDFKRFIFNLLKMKFRAPNRRQVLENMSLMVRGGEKIGIVGPNGSGKSTLLKVICGILRPTTGTVAVVGGIAPLIELGAGFDPELSLVDNVIYYGLLLGIERKRMLAHLDAILDFAELQEHRTEPVKTLSSGMVARLGFAIATEFRPDILILDEVLAVGDESFKRKCQERIDVLWDDHTTIIVVSHDLDFISRQCDRGIWLEKGALKFDGPAPEAVLQYRLSVEADRRSVEHGSPVLLLGSHEANSPHAGLVYALVDGQRRLVRDKEFLALHKLELKEALLFDDNALESIPEGQPIELLSSAVSL
jgi:ABC-type polysaccharide/polyol phosphate transport system ATPase subunit